MSAESRIKPPDLEKPLPAEVVEGDAPPAKETVNAEASVPPPTPSPELRPISRVKALFLTTSYTVAFAIVTLVLCLHGSLTTDAHDRSVFIARTYASILGSVALGPVYFTNKRFMVSMKARHEAINIRLANGRLCKALGHSVRLGFIVIGVVASAALLGHGLTSWPLVHFKMVSALDVANGAIHIPCACLLSGLRCVYEMVSITMWVLIRVPKISTGLEGDKYDRLMKIAYVLTLFIRVPFLMPGSF